MLHPLAFDGVNRLTANFDRETLADFYVRFFGSIRELDVVASRTSRRPCAQDDIERLDLPLVVGRVVLRRPSVGGMEWLRTRASVWWGISTRAYTFALAYACAHRTREEFDLVQSRTMASLRVWMWVLASCASEEALRRAAISLLPPPDDSLAWFSTPGDDYDSSSKLDLMAIAMRLATEKGQTCQYWLWEVSNDDFWAAVCDLADKLDAKFNKASLKAGKGHADGTWWVLQRRALKRCEDRLEADVKKWLEARKVQDV